MTDGWDGETLDFERGKKADKYFVYRLTCLKTKKFYIGKTWCPDKRFAQHLDLAQKTPEKKRSPMQRDLVKWGRYGWRLEVLCWRSSEDEAYDVERILILSALRKQRYRCYNRTVMGARYFNPKLLGDLDAQLRPIKKIVHKDRLAWQRERKRQKNVLKKGEAAAADEQMRANSAEALRRGALRPRLITSDDA